MNGCCCYSFTFLKAGVELFYVLNDLNWLTLLHEDSWYLKLGFSRYQGNLNISINIIGAKFMVRILNIFILSLNTCSVRAVGYTSGTHVSSRRSPGIIHVFLFNVCNPYFQKSAIVLPLLLFLLTILPISAQS